VKRLGLVLLLVATGGWGWDVLRAPDPDVEKGNDAFEAGKYGEALDHYQAAEGRGDDPRIQFDRGTALYKLGEAEKDPAAKAKKMEEAEQAFERAADTDDLRLKSDAYQALGNTLYQRQRFEEAVDKYRRALRANPQNDAARYNLEMALRQRQKNQQQQQQQGQGQQGQQGQQQKPQQDQQQGQQPPQQGGQQGQPDQQDQGQGQQQPDKPQQGQGQGQQDQNPQQGQGQGQQQQKDPTQGNPNAPKQDPGQQQGQDQQQPDQGGQQGPEQQRPGGNGDDEQSEPPSDEEQKLDALEKRSRDLRKRLVRKGSRTRDPLRLPSRKDW